MRCSCMGIRHGGYAQPVNSDTVLGIDSGGAPAGGLGRREEGEWGGVATFKVVVPDYLPLRPARRSRRAVWSVDQ